MFSIPLLFFYISDSLCIKQMRYKMIKNNDIRGAGESILNVGETQAS